MLAYFTMVARQNDEAAPVPDIIVEDGECQQWFEQGKGDLQELCKQGFDAIQKTKCAG